MSRTSKVKQGERRNLLSTPVVASNAKESYGWNSAATAACVVAVGVARATHGRLQPMLVEMYQLLPSASSAKPYRSLIEFYPFYLSEHKNPTSRLLHVIGTTLVIGMLLRTPLYRSYIPNFLIAISIGTIVCECLAPLSNGWIEFALLFVTVGYMSHLQKQPVLVPWRLVVVGYLFAWIGHFWFEHNRPATFIYPTYSLICDFIMWFQTITGRLPLSKPL